MKKTIVNICVFAFVLFLTGAFTAYAAESAAVTLSPGKSYVFANQDADNFYYIVNKNPITQTNNRYDYVSYDKNGEAEAYGSLSGSFLVSGGGSVRLTVTGTAALVFEYPSDVSVTETDEPALYSFAPAAGKSILILNASKNVFHAVSVSAQGGRRQFVYDYVVKDANGYIVSYVPKAEDSGVNIAPGGSFLLTPVEGQAFIELPYEWTADLSFTETDAAALAYYTAAPGGSLRFKNADKNFNYSINNDSGGAPADPRYDCARYDLNGGLYDFEAETSGALYVPADGSTVMTARNGAELKLWMPAEWMEKGVSVSESTEPALFFYELAPGKSVKIKNNDKFNAYALKGNNAGDPLSPRINYTARDADGLITGYGVELNGGAVFLDFGGETHISVVNGYSLKLWAPYGWRGAFSFAETAARAVHVFTLDPGNSVVVNNIDPYMAVSVASDSAAGSAEPGFDYVMKDEDGYIYDYGSADLYGAFNVKADGSAHITAGFGRPLKLWFPEEWLNDTLTINASESPAVREYRLGAGKSADLNSADSTGTLSVKTNSARQFAPAFDFCLRDQTGKVVSFLPPGRYENIALMSLGSCALTAGKDFDLRLLIPDEWISGGLMTITEREAPALYYRDFVSGESVAISNVNADMIMDIPVMDVLNSEHDFVYKNDQGEITDFGVAVSPDKISVGPLGVYALTVNKGAELRVYMPYEWFAEDVQFKGAMNSVVTYTLKTGESAEIANTDKIYAVVVATNAADGPYNPSFDYTIYDVEKEIVSYGTGDLKGLITIPENGKIYITAGRGADLKIWYPFEHHSVKRIVLTKRLEPTLHAFSVMSGRTVDLTNKADEAFNIKNNSGGAFTEPKYDYLFKRPEQPEMEIIAGYGDVAVPPGPGASVKLKAAYGYDLKLWMPYEWLKSITIKEVK